MALFVLDNSHSFVLVTEFQVFLSNINKVKKLATEVEGDQKAPFSIATTLRYWGGRYSFPWIAPL